MLLPLQLFSSIRLKFRVVGEYYSPPLKEITIFISDVAVSNSALQDFFFGINYHDKINGCNFTKLTGMKSKQNKAIFNTHENNYTSKVEKIVLKLMILSQFSLTKK